MSDWCLTPPPEAPAKAVRPARVTDRDPYRVSGPCVVSLSGGRTSAYMLRRVIDAYGGVLPEDVHVVFANTGEEHPGTLDFVRDLQVRWCSRIAWLEYDPEAEHGYREVDYDTASRDGEPLDCLIARKRHLPNWRMRFCTVDLKIGVMAAYMARHVPGGETWTNVVGLRWDEPERVGTLKARPAAWDVACPLYDARVSKRDVAAFWAAQDFDLVIPPWAGNCMGCFLKGRRLRDRGAREAPEVWERWAAREASIGARFVYNEPGGYAAQLDRVRRLPVLPALDLDGEDDAQSVNCSCTS